MASTEGGISLRGVSLAIRGRAVLDGVDLDIQPGEAHALAAGPDDGKTGLCQVLAGLLRPDAGRAFLPPPGDIAMASGKPRAFPQHSVEDNLIYNGTWREDGWFLARSRRSAVLRKWLAANRVELDLAAPMYQFPRGEWIFVEIVGRLVQAPRLLILDEALDGLTPARKREAWSLLGKGLSGGMALFWTSGKPDEVLTRGGRVSVMRRGRILLTDAAGNLDRFHLVRLLHDRLDSGEAPGGAETARESFHKTMRFTEAILLDIPSGILVIDPDLDVRFANRSAFEMFGLPENSGLGPGRSLEGFLGEANRRLLAIVREAVAAGAEDDWHGLPLTTAGQGRLVDLRLRAIREGRLTAGHMLVLDDVSMREELRRRLAMSENLASVGLLAAGVAHEVNNPLEIIGNYLSFLKRGRPTGDVGEAIGQIEAETSHIKRIVRKLVAFSGGAPQPIPSRTDLVGLAREVCSLMSFQGKSRGIDFRFDGPDSPLWVAANPVDIRQMLLNLLLNSVDALAKGGRVEVKLRREGEGDGGIRLTVEDNGPGIKLERVEDVFLPFVSTKAPDGRHQGLGLSIVYGIVESCGGAVSVENPPGGGCRFILRLPPARMPKED
ncbi:MAG: ATP-binding cassette domain-containing protein [Planctomycetota bacterium]|jgi:signal transduction histidine kinase/ABC-type multidrug transport system ATPase subunit|nr:ATP-binding cassette domain-containing protein [Planctomycetota bacterium]